MSSAATKIRRNPARQKKLTLADLSPEARAVAAAKAVQGRFGLKTWKKLLAELAVFDAGTDAQAGRAKALMLLFLALAIIAGIGTVAVAASQKDFALVLQARAALIGTAAALAIFLGLFLRYFVRKRRLDRINLANDFRHLLPALFDDLGEDTGDKAKVRISLELSGPVKTKIIARRKLPSKLFTTLIQTTYRDPWLQMAALLADGNIVLLKVDNFYTLLDRRRWQTSRSGKIKRKRKLKWRKVVVAAVSLIPAGEAADWDETKVGKNLDGMKLKRKQKKGEAVLTLVKKYKFKQIATPPEATIPPSEVLGMMMRLYSMLAVQGSQAPPPLAKID